MRRSRRDEPAPCWAWVSSLASFPRPRGWPAGRASEDAPTDRGDWQAEGHSGAVTAGGREAVAAGLEILKSGGNAADAAAATILALSVTDSRSFCFGGEVPILVYDAKTRASR